MNNIARDYLNAGNVVNKTGIVFADFPGAGLISAIININELNVPPVAEAGGPYENTEGDTRTLIAADSFDLNNEPLLYRWDIDGDGTFETNFDPSPTYDLQVPDNGVFNVVLEVTDGVFVASDTTTVTATNVAPAVTLNPLTTNENDLATISGTFVDPGLLDTFVVSIDFGDGSAPAQLNLAAGVRSFSVAHRYLDDLPSGTPLGVYTAGVAILDDDNGFGSDTLAVTVNNLDPALTIDEVRDGLGTLIADGMAVFTHDRIDVAGSFTDPGTLDTHGATIDWGDGTTDDLGPTSGAVSASHVYDAAFVHLIQLTVTDDDTGSATSPHVVTVLSPDEALLSAVDELEAAANAASSQAVSSRLGVAAQHLTLALDLLDDGPGASGNSTLPAAMIQIGLAIQSIESAETASGLDLEDFKIFLAQAAQSAARNAVAVAEMAGQSATVIAEATLAIADGTYLIAVGDYQDAVDTFRAAVLLL